MKETFEGAALRGEQEAHERLEVAGRAFLLLAERAADVRERAAALAKEGKYAAAYGVLSLLVDAIVGVERPAPAPAKYRCGHEADPGGLMSQIREPLRSHLAKQDCLECRKGVRT